MASNFESSRENKEEVRIVLVGKTGIGKSATGNTILGQQCFVSKFSSKSMTVDCSKRKAEVDGQQVVVIDTPSLFDTRFDKDKTTKDICQCITYAAPGPHVFLVVIRLDRYTEEEKQTVQKIQEIFGQDADRHSMVLFTHGDLLEDTTIEDFLAGYPDLQELVDRCNGQYHVFNNKLKDRSQVTELLQKIRNLGQKNRRSHYTDKMFQDAWRAIEEEKQRILKEKEEQIRKEKQEVERKLQEKYGKEMKKMNEQYEAERERERKEREEESRTERVRWEMETEREGERREREDERERECNRWEKEREREMKEREEERRREKESWEKEMERERKDREEERSREKESWEKEMERERTREREESEEKRRTEKERWLKLEKGMVKEREREREEREEERRMEKERWERERRREREERETEQKRETNCKYEETA